MATPREKWMVDLKELPDAEQEQGPVLHSKALHLMRSQTMVKVLWVTAQMVFRTLSRTTDYWCQRYFCGSSRSEHPPSFTSAI